MYSSKTYLAPHNWLLNANKRNLHIDNVTTCSSGFHMVNGSLGLGPRSVRKLGYRPSNYKNLNNNTKKEEEAFKEFLKTSLQTIVSSIYSSIKWSFVLYVSFIQLRLALWYCRSKLRPCLGVDTQHICLADVKARHVTLNNKCFQKKHRKCNSYSLFAHPPALTLKLSL